MLLVDDCSNFGTTALGHATTLYTLKSPTVEVDITDYGATIVAIRCLDKYGRMDDVVAGYPDVTGYDRGCSGLISPQVDAFAYRSCQCDVGKNVWRAETDENRSIRFLCRHDLRCNNCPGREICVDYKLCGSELQIKQTPSSEASFVAHPVRRIYFNLSGHNSWGDLRNHLITLSSDLCVGKDGNSIPAENTAFDFRKPTFFETERLQLMNDAGGNQQYFHLYGGDERKLAARIKHFQNGRSLTIETTSPLVSLETANAFGNIAGKGGVSYEKHSCLSISPSLSNTFTRNVQNKQAVWLTFSYAL